ncbi:hypothetical protein [Streptomyces sp. KR80]|uniref:hypothetical protein n=1 Tax=Streptomyces sp. KR80 TaxID=3457426 RepID=UPI003FCF1970
MTRPLGTRSARLRWASSILLTWPFLALSAATAAICLLTGLTSTAGGGPFASSLVYQPAVVDLACGTVVALGAVLTFRGWRASRLSARETVLTGAGAAVAVGLSWWLIRYGGHTGGAFGYRIFRGFPFGITGVGFTLDRYLTFEQASAYVRDHPSAAHPQAVRWWSPLVNGLVYYHAAVLLIAVVRAQQSRRHSTRADGQLPRSEGTD